MHIESVEVYSDQSNAVVMRHPGRRFPGVLMQGDTLRGFCAQLDAVCAEAERRLSEDGYGELDLLRNHLRELLDHYKAVLGEHGIPLPFGD
jgi:hypothetical protein